MGNKIADAVDAVREILTNLKLIPPNLKAQPSFYLATARYHHQDYIKELL